MATKHKKQAEAARRARRAAAQQEAREKARRRRRAIGTAVALVAVMLIAGLVLANVGDDDGQDVATDDTPTTTAAPAEESAKGKPCVTVADPLPQGAPAVPVKTGPPPTELVQEDLKVGDGAEVAPGDTITAHYVGVSCSTGKIFDSSYTGGQPATFPLANVIPGWQQGIPGMKIGGQRLLGIPGDLAYGPDGRPGTIAPDETLWFVVELVSIGEPPPSSAPPPSG